MSDDKDETSYYETLVCVGGVSDGERHSILRNARSARMVKNAPLPEATMPAHTIAPSVTISSGYRKEIFHCPDKNFTILVEANMSIADAMERLISGYQSPSQNKSRT